MLGWLEKLVKSSHFLPYPMLILVDGSRRWDFFPVFARNPKKITYRWRINGNIIGMNGIGRIGINLWRKKIIVFDFLKADSFTRG